MSRSTRTASPSPSRRRLLALLPLILAGACTRPGSQREADTSRAHARMLSIADGDSFTASDQNGRRVVVRVGGIDAPEKGQPWADESRDHLARLLARGPLEIEAVKTDPYGRQVSRVFADGLDVGLAQIDAGLAWHFVRYAADQRADERQRYARAEQIARQQRRGLWADPQPLAPWAYRSRKASARTRD